MVYKRELYLNSIELQEKKVTKFRPQFPAEFMTVVVAIVKVLVCVVTSLSFDRLRAPALTIADVEQTTMASESIVTSPLQTDYIFLTNHDSTFRHVHKIKHVI